MDTSPPSPGPPRQRTPSPQPASGTISLPSSDNLRSCHNHLPTPHTITTHPPPPPPPAQQVVSDSEFHTHSPPSLPGPHLDRRHPHTHSPPRDRYRPRNHPKMGPRAPPRPQRGNRGRRPFNRQPRPPVTRPAIDWDGRGEEPMDHHQGGQEDHSGVAASTEYPPNQGWQSVCSVVWCLFLKSSSLSTLLVSLDSSHVYNTLCNVQFIILHILHL